MAGGTPRASAQQEMLSHFARIGPVYRSMRTTDVEPVREIERVLAGTSPISAADIGCGAGRYDRLLFEHLPGLHLTCVDVNATMLEQAAAYLRAGGARNFDLVHSGVEELALADRSLDAVFTFNAVHHFDFAAFLRKACDALRPDGRIFIYTRLPEQNARTLWGRYFPEFCARETRLFGLQEMRHGIERTLGLTFESVTSFRFPRRTPLHRLLDQARSKHYSTFALYEPQEFERALRQFEWRVRQEFDDLERIEWCDENVLIEVRRVESRVSERARPANAWPAVAYPALREREPAGAVRGHSAHRASAAAGTSSPARADGRIDARRPMPPAVILAAGAGSRLREDGDAPPKPLTPLLGRSLLERSIRACREAGVEEFIVVVGYRKDMLVPHLRALAERLGVRLRVAESQHWQLGNGASALASEPYVRGPFFLLMSDHVFAPEFLRRLHTHDDGRRPCSLVVDRSPGWIRDLPEATKVKLRNGRVSAIGKELTTFDGVDTGVFLCRPGLFEALREAAARGRHTLSDAVRTLARRGEVAWAPTGGLFWHDIDTPEDLEFVRERLLAGEAERATLSATA